MGLRDIVLLIAIYGTIPFILRKPFIGVLVWYWLSLMNPHRISWTLQNQPFAEIVFLVWFVSLLAASKEKKQIPATPITITLALFWFWMLVTTIFSFYPQLAWNQWDKVWKIMLTTYIAIMMLNSKERLVAVTLVVAFSIGFFGFKGGLFTILTGGNHKVWGPSGSFIADNNSIGLALIMTIPLLFYLRSLVGSVLVRTAMLVGIVFCFFSVLGTQSRGALLGVTAMGVFLAMKSEKKFGYLLLLALVVPVAVTFMPDTWHERMASINDYQSDASALGRLKAWEMAFNLALHEPFGGGFEAFKPQSYLMYLPEVGARGTDAHSNYFEVLGEHGFVGLALYLMLGFLALSTCARIIRTSRADPRLSWMTGLAAMIQVSLIGYAACGAFLGMAYFDYYYALLAIVVGMTVVAKQYSEQGAEAAAGEPVPSKTPFGSGQWEAPTVPSSALRGLVGRAKQWYDRL